MESLVEADAIDLLSQNVKFIVNYSLYVVSRTARKGNDLIHNLENMY